jgi:hypothetical protein
VNETEIGRYIRETFAGLNVLENAGDLFFLYDPDRDLPPERQMPFATIVCGDNYEHVSDLNQPGTYRLNVGLTKATYTSLFGAVPTDRAENGVYTSDHDYAARDRLMPHPVYAGQYWVCVINPSEATFETVKPLLAEAYEFAVRKHANHRARQRS